MVSLAFQSLPRPSNACWRVSCGGRSITVPTPQSGGARCGNHSPGVQKRHNSSGLSEVGVAGTLGWWDQ